MKSGCYENYPIWIVFVSNLVQLVLYTIGALVIYSLGLAWLFVYLLYILALEIRLFKKSCTKCYYYGRYCAFGKGKLCSFIFKKDDSKKFSQNKISWKDIAPDFLVSIVPIVVGIVMLVRDFCWMMLVFVGLLFLLGFVGSGIIRGFLACKYCKQREIGCPAERLFNKSKSKD